MLKLDTECAVEGLEGTRILKVITQEEWLQSSVPKEKCALWDPDGRNTVQEPNGGSSRWGARIAPSIHLAGTHDGDRRIHSLKDSTIVRPGDVISCNPHNSKLKVLYRRGSTSNTLFLTERCNSRCLMCSQPPRKDDDSWRINDLKELITLIDHDECSLGITGGEPTLLGPDLALLIRMCKEYLPNTALHILTNGRVFSDVNVATLMAQPRHPNLVWGIPLYSDSPDLHDYIVQAFGAFDETVRGIYHVAGLDQRIEIRVVLQNPTIARLQKLAYFIFHNMPFVVHVAFMGLEPIGFFRMNHGLLWVDPSEYATSLEDAVFFLSNRGMQVSVYNLPLCVLPRSIWSFARQSISDWKNYYPNFCEKCAAKGQCGGFFASAAYGWKSRSIRPLTSDDLLCQLTQDGGIVA